MPVEVSRVRRVQAMSKTVSEVPTRRSNSMFPLILCPLLWLYLDILIRVWRSDLADVNSLYPPASWSLVVVYIYSSTRIPRVLIMPNRGEKVVAAGTGTRCGRTWNKPG